MRQRWWVSEPGSVSVVDTVRRGRDHETMSGCKRVELPVRIASAVLRERALVAVVHDVDAGVDLTVAHPLVRGNIPLPPVRIGALELIDAAG
jgi:hypothetical protein